MKRTYHWRLGVTLAVAALGAPISSLGGESPALREALTAITEAERALPETVERINGEILGRIEIDPAFAPRRENEKSGEFFARMAAPMAALAEQRQAALAPALQKLAEFRRRVILTPEVTITLGAYDADAERFHLTAEVTLYGKRDAWRSTLAVPRAREAELRARWETATREAAVGFQPDGSPWLLDVRVTDPVTKEELRAHPYNNPRPVKEESFQPPDRFSKEFARRPLYALGPTVPRTMEGTAVTAPSGRLLLHSLNGLTHDLRVFETQNGACLADLESKQLRSRGLSGRPLAFLPFERYFLRRGDVEVSIPKGGYTRVNVCGVVDWQSGDELVRVQVPNVLYGGVHLDPTGTRLFFRITDSSGHSGSPVFAADLRKQWQSEALPVPQVYAVSCDDKGTSLFTLSHRTLTFAQTRAGAPNQTLSSIDVVKKAARWQVTPPAKSERVAVPPRSPHLLVTGGAVSSGRSDYWWVSPLYLFRTADGSLVGRVGWLKGQSSALSFSRDGAYMLSQGAGTTELWHLGYLLSADPQWKSVTRETAPDSE